MFFQQIDEAISKAMLEIHGSDFINHFLKFFTLLGEAGIIWIISLAALLTFTIIKKKKLPIVLLTSAIFVLFGWIFNDFFLKVVIHRIRPLYNDQAFGDSFRVFMDSIKYSYPTSYSFPSGHSFSSFNAATGITLYKKKLGFIAYPVAFIIAFSRIFIGAHYFTDVLVGSTLGVCFALLGYFIGNTLLKTKKIGEWKYATR